MPTSYKSAPFGVAETRARSQPFRQAALDVTVIHRIAELELELLNIVHDHYDYDLPTVIPLCVPIQGAGNDTHASEVFRSQQEPETHGEGLGRSVCKLISRSQADQMSCDDDTAEHDIKQRDTSTVESELLNA